MPINPNSLELFRNGEVFPFVGGKSTNNLEYFRNGEIFLGILLEPPSGDTITNKSISGISNIRANINKSISGISLIGSLSNSNILTSSGNIGQIFWGNPYIVYKYSNFSNNKLFGI